MSAAAPLQLNRDPGAPATVRVARWCVPVRVWVVAMPERGFPGHLDPTTGRPLYCVWQLPTLPEGEASVLAGPERIYAAPGRREVWTDCGSLYLRTGGELFVAGGNGNWTVEVWAAPEVTREPSRLWLTTFHGEEAPTSWPPGATDFRLLSGAARCNAQPLLAGAEYPATAASPQEIYVRGFWQAGTVV